MNKEVQGIILHRNKVNAQGSKDDKYFGYKAVVVDTLVKYISTLETAIRETLEENGHLADGENCTLIKLKKAIGKE